MQSRVGERKNFNLVALKILGMDLPPDFIFNLRREGIEKKAAELVPELKGWSQIDLLMLANEIEALKGQQA